MKPGIPVGPGTILLDFDGTVSVRDVGNRVFDRISRGAVRAVIDSWKSGRIGSRECLIRECSVSRATRDRVLALAGEESIDPGLGPLLRVGRRFGWRVGLVSDGLDLYIRALLTREGWGSLPLQSNRVRFLGDRLLPSFPRAGRGCGRCGNCKGGAVEEARARGPVVFVGNGLSDRCAVPGADVVFAKDALARYCKEEGYPARGYRNLEEVAKALAEAWSGSAAAPVNA